MKLSLAAIILTIVSPALEQMGISQIPMDMLDQVNAHRRANNLPALCLNEKLMIAAQRHSQNQADAGVMAHNGVHNGINYRDLGDRVKATGYLYGTTAENIFGGPKTVKEAMIGWIRSPGHNRNLLKNGITHLGVGVARSKDGKLFWTQVFGKPLREGTEGCINQVARQAKEKKGNGQLKVQLARDMDAVAVALLAKLNQYREENNVGPLCINEKLMQASMKHAVIQAKSGVLAHRGNHNGIDFGTAGQRLESESYQWRSFEETIAFARSIREVLNVWKASGRNNARLLAKDLKQVGLGVARGPDGRIYWSQMLAQPLYDGAEECI